MSKGKQAPAWTYAERKMLEKYATHKSVIDLAEAMDRNRYSIYRELQRCEKGRYRAKQAQIDAEEKRRNKPAGNIAGKVMQRLETCVRMSPLVDAETVAEITGVNIAVVQRYLQQIKRRVLTQ